MTRIKKLYLHGFKSFAKKTEIVFGDDFNCVLGPNGSGKSNIMDALCFVLGKSSAKSMRADKSANLIYNGGKTKNPMKEAEVSILFDNEKREFPIEENDVKITRIVKNNGQSVYRINGKNVTRQQIIDMLSMAKINPDGYNIILQGDIVRFVEMSGSDRRGIIEEIGGISTYEEKRQKSLKMLDGVEEKLKEVEIIMNERSTYLKELKKERDQAIKYKELDDKIKKNKTTLISLDIEKREKKLSESEGKLKETKAETDKKQVQIDKNKKFIIEKTKELDKINKEVEEKGDKEQVKIQKEIEELKIKQATDKSKLENTNNEISKVNTRINELNKTKKDQDGRVKIIEKEKANIEKKIKNNIIDIEKIDKKIQDFKKKHDLEGSDNKEKEIEQIEKDVENKQLEISKLREEEQNILREKDKCEYQINSCDERINKVMEVEKENKKDIERLKQKKLEFKKATTELNTKLNDNSEISAQLLNARDKYLASSEELTKLNAKQANISEKIAGGVAIEKVIAQKNKISGIYGTVSELGHVKSEHSMALEVAAGSRIKSIVVQEDKVASECIKFLKSNMYGTCTFLPLNKIKSISVHPELNRILKTPGVIGKATDLITYDPKFEKVFSYVFGGAIVVKNLEVARKIGIGSIKMVTLDGDITEVSGAMQGGFRKKNKGMGFAEKEVVGQIENLEKEVADLQSTISTLQKRKQDNEDSIEKLRELKANLEGEIIKTEKSLHLDSDDLDANNKLKDELKEKIKEYEDRLDVVENQISKINNELTQLKIKKQDNRDKINALKNPRILAELNTFEQKKQELKEENIKITAEKESMEAQLKTTVLPEHENLNKILKQHQKEVESFELQIKELTKVIKEQDKNIKDMEINQKKFYQQFKHLFTKRDTLNKEITKIESDIIKYEEQIRGLEQRSSMINVDIARVRTEISALVEENKQYEGVEIFKSKTYDQVKEELRRFERQVNDIGMVNMRSLEIYESVNEEYNKLLEKQKTLSKEKNEILVMMNEIETKKKDLFVKTFEVVNNNFKNKFKTLSTKGEAFLEIENQQDPFSGGVSINVRLTGKKFMDIRSLSGGEKTMTALALIFAIQDHEPSTFYILDEVDAALDKRNAEKLAELVREYSDKAQYIIISHNDGVISEADNLYGVSMDEHGMSKIVSLKI